MLKKFLIGTFALAVLLIGVTASAAYDFGPTTLKVGSTGQYVMNLQTAVGATPVDGVFGPMTKAKVMAWQASNGLVADGLVGPATKNAINAGSYSGTTCPVGSFDPMTGLPCGTTAPNLPAGCTSTAGFSPLTGVSCSSAAPQLPAGCTSTAGFSVTTGQSCSGGTTPGGVLTGEGSVDTFTVGSAEDSDVSEGQTGVELIAFDLELEDEGDLKLDRFDLYMGELNGGTHSSRPWEYFDRVVLKVNGTQVADMDVDSKGDWSENNTGTLTTTSQEYRLRFNGLNAFLESGENAEITVEFDTASNLDSADVGATWYYGTTVTSLRLLDGSGFMFEDGDDLEDTFTFDSALMAGLRLASSSNDPEASVIEVDNSSDTNGVELAVFEIEEREGADVTVTEMTVTLASATGETITNMVKKLYLYEGSSLVGTETVTGATVTFDNLSLDIDADDTVEITVKADLDDTNNQVRYQNGDKIQVSAINLTEYMDEYDNDEGDFTETGSFAGKVHTLFADGVSIALVGSPTTEITDDGVAGFTSTAQFTWVIDVTAFGDNDVYLNKDIADIVASDTAADVDMIYSVEKSGGADLTSLGGTVVCTSSCSNVTNVTGTTGYTGDPYNGETFFKLLKGKTARFTISVSGSNQIDSKQVRALLNNVEWTIDDVTDTTAAVAATINPYTVGLGADAATPFKVIN